MTTKSVRPMGTRAVVPDLRTGQRFPLQLPIAISDGHSAHKNQGTTTNVSAAGVYVRAQRPLRVGSKITFDINLPGPVLGTAHDVKIRCAGRVVRAESSRVPRTKPAVREKLRGMACVIDQYRFVRN